MFEQLSPQAERCTAVILIAPREDAAVAALYNEGQKLAAYAKTRVIASNDDIIPATDDLALIAKLLKAIKEKQKEYQDPIRHHLDAVRKAFEEFTAPLVEADLVNRGKILTFKRQQDERIAEAQRIEEEKLALAKREAALNDGETTVDLSPVPAPPAPPARVHTDMGTASTAKIAKYEVVDFGLLPEMYKMVDSSKLGAVVRAAKGQITIPGVRIWTEETIRVNTR